MNITVNFHKLEPLSSSSLRGEHNPTQQSRMAFTNILLECFAPLAITILLIVLSFISLPAFAAMPSLNFTVNMSEIVNVDTTGGTPRIILKVDNNDRIASYVTGTGTNALTFTYVPTIGDLDLDGITFKNPTEIIPNGGTIKDTAGNDASLTFSPPVTTGVKINYPSLSMDFVYDADGRYTLNGEPYDTLPALFVDAGGSFTRASIGTYFNISGVMQTATNNTPRFDYDPTTHAAKGILLEDARTNSIKNSTMQNAVVGTPGTLPTNWQTCYTGGGATCTSSITGKGIVNGMNYIDVRLQGNMPASGAYVNILVADQTASATWLPITNTDYVSGQIRLALIAGTFPFTGISFIVSEQNGSTYLTNRSLKNITSGSLTGTLTNFSGSAAAVNSTVNNVVQPRLVIGSIGSLTTYDFTLRVATPQIEKGTFPTSFIPTTTVAVTRQEDVLTVPTGSWYSQTAGSFSNNISWISSSGTSYPMFFRVDNTTNSERWNMFYNQSSNGIGIDAVTGSINQGSLGASAVGTTGSIKAAGAQTTNNTNAAFNGVLKTQDTSWSTPSVTRLILAGSGAAKWHSNLKYYPSRVTDTQLQLMSQ